ncbi:anthranilate synthase component I family protein [bacterium]|nr:anthranilate synthase component I family protein [bacterium]
MSDSARKFAPTRPPKLGRVTGSALFWPNDESGWKHPPICLPRPVLVMYVDGGGTRVETPEGQVVASNTDRALMPFRWTDEILSVLADSCQGTERRPILRPILPMAALSVSYEYGRTINPYEHCFPHAEKLEVPEFFAAFHTSGFVWSDERWRLVGRPLGRHTRWKDWRPQRADLEWPAPPGMPPAIMGLLEDTPPPETDRFSDPIPCLDRDAHAAAVECIHDHLTAGDIYQANLTSRFESQTSADADSIFAMGLSQGGNRFAANLRGPSWSAISFSPELFIRKWGPQVMTRPIKGTRRRTGQESSDAALGFELLDSEKDRAEHIMIVDLERNDLGRICDYGTVRVEKLMELTSHPSILHLESTITGRARSSARLSDLFGALFPGGSISGAPKRRALEIIGQLENRPRGIYCGALGWVDARGDVELNLPIRTAVRFDDGRVHLHAGGGIVADSDPAEEWEEMQAKLKFLCDAIRLAEMK